MAGVDVDDLEQREELAHDGQHLVGDVLALGAPDEERGPLEAHPAGLLVGEVAHVRQGAAEDVDGDAEPPRLVALGRVEVPEEELPDGEGLYFQLVHGVGSVSQLILLQRQVWSSSGDLGCHNISRHRSS